MIRPNEKELHCLQAARVSSWLQLLYLALLHDAGFNIMLENNF